jgi:hypothetical protein
MPINQLAKVELRQAMLKLTPKPAINGRDHRATGK